MKKIILLFITILFPTLIFAGTKYQFDALSRVEYINLADINAAYTGYAFGCKKDNWVYLAPAYNSNYSAVHGHVARYNTLKRVDDTNAWEFYDLPTYVDENAKGFHGCVSIGDYIYYIPLYRGTLLPLNGHVTRYHETGASNSFTTVGNWSVFDMETDATLNCSGCIGYVGGTTDGQYLYLAPYGYMPNNQHGWMVRYDTTKAFDNSTGGWEKIDVGTDVNSVLKGYHFACYDGSRYVYYSPFANGATYVFHGYVARFDKGASGTNVFTNSANWDWVNLTGTTGNANAKGFYGCVKGDKYIYFSNNTSQVAVRFDTTGTFQNGSHLPTSSWEWQDMITDVISPTGYAGIDVGDDGYVYYAPDFDVATYAIYGTAVKCKANVTDWPNMQSASSKSDCWETVAGNTLFNSYYYVDLTKKNSYLKGSHGVIWTPEGVYFISIHSANGVASGYISRHKFILDPPRSKF